MLKVRKEQSQGAPDRLLEKIWETGFLNEIEMAKVRTLRKALTKLSIQLYGKHVGLERYQGGDGQDLTEEEIAKDLAVAAIGSSFPHGFLQAINDLTGECLNAQGYVHVT